MKLGYCCNVHPGVTLEEVQNNLQTYSLAIKQSVAANKPMGIGLWLSATAARELKDPWQLSRFSGWLNESQLIPFTLNGFPFGDFHKPVVKHEVYSPSWTDPARVNYTVELANILAQLLVNEDRGTISTLPLGWPTNLGQKTTHLASCAANLTDTAKELADLEDATGKRISLCIEPEPGCWLDSADDVIDFFDHYLLAGDSRTADINRRYLQVCHDVCHSAVMFEPQQLAIEKYHLAGIEIGKLQVSSALSVDFDRLSKAEKETVVQQLHQFAEPKYLHQTVWRQGAKQQFFDDLPLALAAVDRMADWHELSGTWRVHFHVPIFAENLGLMETTQTDIENCLDQMHAFRSTPNHIEIETYAWNVLPHPWQPESLVDGIVQEWQWLEKRCQGPFS